MFRVLTNKANPSYYNIVNATPLGREDVERSIQFKLDIMSGFSLLITLLETLNRLDVCSYLSLLKCSTSKDQG